MYPDREKQIVFIQIIYCFESILHVKLHTNFRSTFAIPIEVSPKHDL